MADKKKQYPIRIKIGKPVPAKRESESLPADSLQKGAVERGNREQARETEELRRMNMKKKPVSKFAMGGSVKGSGMKKADGIAKKGKTKTKMVKMAGGGSCGPKKMPKKGMKKGY